MAVTRPSEEKVRLLLSPGFAGAVCLGRLPPREPSGSGVAFASQAQEDASPWCGPPPALHMHLSSRVTPASAEAGRGARVRVGRRPFISFHSEGRRPGPQKVPRGEHGDGKGCSTPTRTRLWDVSATARRRGFAAPRDFSRRAARRSLGSRLSCFLADRKLQSSSK